MPDQLQENRTGRRVHLKLVPYVRLPFTWDQGRIEIYIIGNTAKVIFGCQFHISADTECKLAFPVCQQETGGFRFVEAGALCFIHDPDNLVARLVNGDKHNGVWLIILNHNFLGLGMGRNQSHSEQ